jgi:hypothetical protein
MAPGCQQMALSIARFAEPEESVRRVPGGRALGAWRGRVATRGHAGASIHPQRTVASDVPNECHARCRRRARLTRPAHSDDERQFGGSSAPPRPAPANAGMLAGGCARGEAMPTERGSSASTDDRVTLASVSSRGSANVVVRHDRWSSRAGAGGADSTSAHFRGVPAPADRNSRRWARPMSGWRSVSGCRKCHRARPW